MRISRTMGERIKRGSQEFNKNDFVFGKSPWNSNLLCFCKIYFKNSSQLKIKLERPAL